MAGAILKQAWAERRNLPLWLGGTSGVVIHALLVALLGFYAPFRLGIDWLDPLIVIPYWCASLIFVAGAAPEAFSGPKPCQNWSSKLLAVSGGGWLYAAVIVLLALLTVNTRHWHGQMLLPAGAVRWAAPLLSFSAAAGLAAFGARLSAENHPAPAVKGLLRGGLWGVTLLLIAGPAVAPVALREWLAPHLTTPGLARLCVAGSLLSAALAACQIRRALRQCG
jgi:hypothetical protein